MEMEFKDTERRRRILLIVVGVLLAVAAGGGAYLLAQGGNKAAPVITAGVVVAARDIVARTPITAEDVTVRQVPVDEALPQTYREVAQVVGRLTSVPVYADQQMTPNLFATAVANSDFSILGPDELVTTDSPAFRAVSVQVPAERAVGGELTAGQHVDLIFSVQFDIFAVDPEGNYQKVDTATAEGLMSGVSTKITLQDIEVLKAIPDDELYVLRVDLHQAEQIAHVIQLAPDAFTMVLRPDEDTRVADKLQYGETTDRLIQTYLFPIPQLGDLTQLVGIPQPTTVPASPVPGGSPLPSGSPAPSGSPQASPAP
jgi:Flp pilus assembly protein CpaB